MAVRHGSARKHRRGAETYGAGSARTQVAPPARRMPSAGHRACRQRNFPGHVNGTGCSASICDLAQAATAYRARKASLRDNRSIRALPAGITNRVGRLRRTPVAANTRSRGGHLYLYQLWSRRSRPWRSRPVCIDVRSMFARMSRYAPADAVSAARLGYGQPRRTAGSGIQWRCPALACSCPGSASFWRNSAYAVSSARQAA
jgi:hypothetical protein